MADEKNLGRKDTPSEEPLDWNDGSGLNEVLEIINAKGNAGRLKEAVDENDKK